MIELPPNGTGTIVETITPTGIPANTEREVVALGDATTYGNRAKINADGSIQINEASSSTGASTSVAGAVADTLLLAANTARRGATVFNDSTAVLYLLLGTTAASATNYTVQLTANAYYEIPFDYAGMIRGIWSSAAGNARVTELT